MGCPATPLNAPTSAAAGAEVATRHEGVAVLVVASVLADRLACTGTDPAIQRDAAVLGALTRARLAAARAESATVATDEAVRRARAEVARYSSSGSVPARAAGGVG